MPLVFSVDGGVFIIISVMQMADEDVQVHSVTFSKTFHITLTSVNGRFLGCEG